MFGEASSPSYCTGYQSRPLSDSKTVATWSFWISFLACSAKVGQSEAPSSMIGSIFLPSTPPLALISSIAISSASLTEVSLIDIVPISEWSTPTLTEPLVAGAAAAGLAAGLAPGAGLTAGAAGAAGLAASVGLAAAVGE